MVLDFNKSWKVFKEGREDSVKLVNLPHDAMITEERCKCLNGANTGYFPGGKYVYEKIFEISEEMIGKYIAVFFEGIYRCANIYLNGEHVFYHAYGYTEFEVDISEKVKLGENVISVEADNSLEPNARWYTGSGIYRPVSLIIKNKNYMKGIKIETKSINPAVISVTCNQDADVIIYDGDTPVASGKTGELGIPDAKLWTAETPNLYRVVLKTEFDEEEVQFGIRLLTWSGKTGVLINGQEVKLRGACIHHDNGLLGACEFDDASYRRIRILKEGGYNAIRSSHNPCSNAILRACDELGMYVVDETFDMWYLTKCYHDYSRDFMDNYKDDIAAVIKKDYNHPSVIMYSIGNENSEPRTEKGMELAREQTKLFKDADPTRIVSMGANLLLLKVNLYKDEKKEYKREPIDQEKNKDLMAGMDTSGSAGFNLMMNMLPKFLSNASNGKKCQAKADELVTFLDVLGLNYGTCRYEQDVLRDPDRLYVGSETFSHGIDKNWKLVKKYPQIIGDFVWTGWDYLGEAGTCGTWDYVDWPGLPLYDGSGTIDATGLITPQNYYMQIEYGTYTKPYISVRPVTYAGHKHTQGAWRMTDAVRSWSWQGCEGEMATVEVYADAAKAELFLNGKSCGKKALKAMRTKFKVKYCPGELAVNTYDKEGRLVGKDSLVTASNTTMLEVKTEKTKLKANGQDLAYLTISLTDEGGNIKPAADMRVTLKIDGEAVSLAGLGSARTKSDEAFDKDNHLTHFGRALAVLRAGYEKGTVKVTVSCDGMEDAIVLIDVE